MLAALLASVLVANAAPATAQVVSPPAADPAVSTARLNEALGRLASNPADAEALLSAGDAALALGDAEAAQDYLQRADRLWPGNARLKAKLGAAMSRNEHPMDALRLFDEAERAGLAAAALAGERGLAYDLVGAGSEAQRHYRQALASAPDDEITRRLAISMAIVGDRRQFEALLLPQLQRQVPAAWRTRSFGLAILGAPGEALALANRMMPPALAQQMAPYLRSMARLTPGQKAAAAHLGHFPQVAAIGRADPRHAAFADQRASAGTGADASLVPQGKPLGGSAATARSARQRAQDERQRVREQRQRATAERQRAMAERQRAAVAERQRATAERQRATAERQRITAERQRAAAEGWRGRETSRPAARVAANQRRSGGAVAGSAQAAGSRPAGAVAPPRPPVPAPAQQASRPATSPRFAQPPFAPPMAAPAVASPPFASPPPAPLAASATPMAAAPGPAAVAPSPGGGAPASVLLPSGLVAPPSIPAVPVPLATPSGASETWVVAPPASPAVPLPLAAAPIPAAPSPGVMSAGSPAAAATPPPFAPSAPTPLAPTSPPAFQPAPAPAPLLPAIQPAAPAGFPPPPPPPPSLVPMAMASPPAGPVLSAPMATAPAASSLPPSPPTRGSDLAAAFSGFVPPPEERAASLGPPAANLAVPVADTPPPPVRARAAPAAASARAGRREPAATPPAEPRRVWVQLGTGRDRQALASDWRRLARQAPDALGARKPWLAAWGQGSRLLVGPFTGEREAQAVLNRLRREGVEAIVWTSLAGQAVAPMPMR